MSTPPNLFQQVFLAMEARDYERARQLVKEGLVSDPTFVKGKNITVANWLLLAADWALITQLLPQRTNFFVESGWLQSLGQNRPINAEKAPIPWFTYPAIDFLEQRLRPNLSVFEFGSGMSTLWWSKRVRFVHAVDHDVAWHKTVKTQLDQSPNRNWQVDLLTKEGDYVRAIAASSHGPFDVVVIDGEWRNACARMVLNCIKEDGMIVFDNSDRASFADGIRFLSAAGWRRLDFFGLIPCYLYKNCTSVFFRDERVLNTDLLPSEFRSSVGCTCSQAIGE